MNSKKKRKPERRPYGRRSQRAVAIFLRMAIKCEPPGSANSMSYFNSDVNSGISLQLDRLIFIYCNAQNRDKMR